MNWFLLCKLFKPLINVFRCCESDQPLRYSSPFALALVATMVSKTPLGRSATFPFPSLLHAGAPGVSQMRGTLTDRRVQVGQLSRALERRITNDVTPPLASKKAPPARSPRTNISRLGGVCDVIQALGAGRRAERPSSPTDRRFEAANML